MKTENPTLTLTGKIAAIEESRGSTLWVALVFEGYQWKAIFRDELAEEVLTRINAGNEATVSGTTFKAEHGKYKLFADFFARV